MKTRERYFNAVHPLLPLLETHRDLDNSLCLWIEAQYSEGKGLGKVSDALCGLQHFAPWTKGRLVESWKLFKIWRKAERPRQAPPLPESFALAFIARALEMEDLSLAVCIALGFWGMLRTGEILKVSTSHILLSKTDVIVQLGETKTSLRRAVDENIVVRHLVTFLLCQTLLQKFRGQATLVWGRSSTDFRTSFNSLVAFFGLNKAFRPYSLRRGGVTADFQQHGQMERTLLRGRWNTSTAARQYIQQGLGALTEISITQTSAKRLKHYQTLLEWALQAQIGGVEEENFHKFSRRFDLDLNGGSLWEHSGRLESLFAWEFRMSNEARWPWSHMTCRGNDLANIDRLLRWAPSEKPKSDDLGCEAKPLTRTYNALAKRGRVRQAQCFLSLDENVCASETRSFLPSPSSVALCSATSTSHPCCGRGEFSQIFEKIWSWFEWRKLVRTQWKAWIAFCMRI